MTAWQMFERGELDWIGGTLSPIPPDSTQMIRASHPVQCDPLSATTACFFQTHHPYLSNRNLRKAFALAINRDEIVSQITQMGEITGTRCIPPTLMGFRNKTLLQSFDPEMARLYLARALHELGIDPAQLNGLSLSFRVNDRLIAQAIQRQWKEVLNIDIDLKHCESSAHRENLQRRNYECPAFLDRAI